MRHTPENITKLEENEVFVFGSNLAAQHAGGAARTACHSFLAEWGVGEGLTGRCYAFPTLDQDFKKRTKEELEESARKFIETAQANTDKTFLLTKVGIGIAGYAEQDMIALFANTPSNVVKPLGW